jgi:hypothetical protein
MRIRLYFGITALLLPAVAAFAAEVDYQHPNITIVASNEPLDSVLKSVSREMHIFVTTPRGFNPIVNCDIQRQPLEKAFKTLMGGISYSLEWKNDGQQLAGLTILSGSGETDAATDDGRGSVVTSVNPVSVMPDATHSASGFGQRIEPDSDSSSPAAHNDGVATESRSPDDSLNTGGETPEVVARKLDEQEIERELRRQEEVIAREERLEEDTMRNQAEMAEHFETLGISPNP